MSEQLKTSSIKLLEGAKRYVLTNMVWYEDTTFRHPKLSDLGELIVNLIDDEIERQQRHKKDPWACPECGTSLYSDYLFGVKSE